jgi:hypothetical protein
MGIVVSTKHVFFKIPIWGGGGAAAKQPPLYLPPNTLNYNKIVVPEEH